MESTNRGQVVVGVDGSPQSVEALRLAARLAPLGSVSAACVSHAACPVLVVR